MANILEVTEGRTDHPKVRRVQFKAAVEMKAMKTALAEGETHDRAARLVADEPLRARPAGIRAGPAVARGRPHLYA